MMFEEGSLFNEKPGGEATRGKTREKKRNGSKKDYFSTPALRAIKKIGRSLFDAIFTLLSPNMDESKARAKASAEAVEEIHRRHPCFISEWEAKNGEKWKGDIWFGERIDHQSENQANKRSHLELEAVVEHLARDSRVYPNWNEFERAVADGVQTVEVNYHGYLLPFKFAPTDSSYSIQKPGIAQVLKSRYVEHSSRGQRGTMGDGLWPASWFLATVDMGRKTRGEARKIEQILIAAVSNGKPPYRGDEWFETDTLSAYRNFIKACDGLGLEPETNWKLLSLIIDKEMK